MYNWKVSRSYEESLGESIIIVTFKYIQQTPDYPGWMENEFPGQLETYIIIKQNRYLSCKFGFIK
jgi:hypothetical protein